MQVTIASAIVIFCTLINLLVWFMYHARQNKPAPPKQEEQHTYYVSIYKASEYKNGQRYVDMTHRAIVKTNHTMN
jgi:lysylphosphatidylglycerol synthetase-like protein (DUF2156 family)